MLYLVYVLHWPDDSRFTAETCSPDVIDISSLCWCTYVVFETAICIYLLLHNGMAPIKYDRHAWSIKECVFARSDFLMAVVIELTTCFDLMPCSLVEIYWRFGATCYPHLLSCTYFRLLYSDPSLGTGCSEWGLDCVSSDPPVYSLIQACIWLWPLFFHKFSFFHSRCFILLCSSALKGFQVVNIWNFGTAS